MSIHKQRKEHDQGDADGHDANHVESLSYQPEHVTDPVARPNISGVLSNSTTLEHFVTGTGTVVVPSISLHLPYDAVILSHQKGRPNIAQKTVHNEISALRWFMGRVGDTGSSDCAWMGDSVAFEGRLKLAKVEDSKIRSALSQFRSTVCSVIELRSPTNNLWESYLRAHQRHVRAGGKLVLMGKKSFILRCFNATGIDRKRLYARKILVHGATFERIRELEHSLAADGELTCWLINMSDNNAEKFQTEYSKRVSGAVTFNYAFAFEEWPEDAKREWSELFLLRTEPLKASRKWHLELEHRKRKKLFTWRIRKNDGACPSADNRRQELEWFYGWCLLPPVLLPDGTKNYWRSGPDRTINKKELTLALMTDQELFDGYLDFRKAHTLTEQQVIAGERGRFNRSCNNFVEFTSSLLNPASGFIYLRKDLFFRPDDATTAPNNLASHVGYEFFNEELAKKVKVTDPDERWLYFCKGLRSYMELIKANEFDPSLVTRERDPIANILALDDPMQAIVELRQKLDDSEPVIEYWRHFHHRKKLFFLLMSVCPLRVLQYAFMSGKHLTKMEASSGRRAVYRIHFQKDEFKNERFIREKDYELNLPEDFTAFIDSYLAYDWPALNGRLFTKDERVFSAGLTSNVVNSSAPTNKQLNKWITHQLQKLCVETTARHLGEKYKTPGFGPHSMRHIKATSIIKLTGSYEEAALHLWDAIETVKRAYAHVTRVEQLAQASRDDYERQKAAVTKLRDGS